MRARVESSVLLLNQLITTTDPTSKYSIFLQIEPQKPPIKIQNQPLTANTKNTNQPSFHRQQFHPSSKQPLRLPSIQKQRTIPLIAHQANPRTNKNRKEKGNGNHLLVLRQSVHRSGSGVDGRVGRLRHCKSRRRRGGDESLGVPLHRSLTERPFPFDYQELKPKIRKSRGLIQTSGKIIIIDKILISEPVFRSPQTYTFINSSAFYNCNYNKTKIAIKLLQKVFDCKRYIITCCKKKKKIVCEYQIPNVMFLFLNIYIL